MNATLTIRTALASDRDAVFAFTDRVWEGHDYIRQVWDEWLAAGDGPFFTGVCGEEPVAIAKVSDMGNGQLWLRGLRVSDAVRGRGYARQITEHCLDYARRKQFKVVRYMTDRDNGPMNHLAEIFGFTLLVSPVWFESKAEGEPWELVTLSEEKINWLENAFSTTQPQRGMGEYYVGPWCIQVGDRESLVAHLHAGEVWLLPGTDAFAIVVTDQEYIWLAGAGGKHADLVRLLRQLPSHPGRTSKAEIITMVLEGTPLAAALAGAGYEQDEGGENIWELFL